MIAPLLAPGLLHSCGGRLGDEARVRLVNATNNCSGLHVVVDDETIISATAIGSSSANSKVTDGGLSFELRSSGSSSAVASTSASIARDEHRTLLACVTDGSLQVVSIGEDEDAPDEGKARLKVLNAASGEVASVDVFLVDMDCTALDDTDVPAFADVTGVDDSRFSQITAASDGTSYRLCVTTSEAPADLTLLVAGSATEPTLRLLEDANLPSPSAQHRARPTWPRAAPPRRSRSASAARCSRACPT